MILMVPGNQDHTERVFGGQFQQHPFPVLLMQGSIAIPLQAGDADRMGSFPEPAVDRSARSRWRGHVSAVRIGSHSAGAPWELSCMQAQPEGVGITQALCRQNPGMRSPRRAVVHQALWAQPHGRAFHRS